MSDIIKLSHNQYLADIKGILDAKATKKKLDADSRTQKGLIDTLKSVLFIAMKGAKAARCGSYLITLKPEKINPGTMTLKDGRVIPLSTITDIHFHDAQGNYDVITPDAVKTWFGGSRISEDLEITNTGEST